MQELEKILEEIDKQKSECLSGEYEPAYEAGALDMANVIKEIICKHMNDGWISVDDRLPEVGEYVLGTNKYDEVLIYHYGWNGPHSKKMFFHLCGAAADIIAWRPLPDPYRPERSEGE